MTSAPRFSLSVERVRALMWIPQACLGLFLLRFAFFIGHDHFDLIRNGVSAQGRIVDFKQINWWKSSDRSFHTTADLPIVEFSTGPSTIRFVDWLGGRKGEYRNVVVPVLYLKAQPSTAMIDRPLWNWIPWGPTAAVGVLLTLAALQGLWRFLRS